MDGKMWAHLCLLVEFVCKSFQEQVSEILGIKKSLLLSSLLFLCSKPIKTDDDAYFSNKNFSFLFFSFIFSSLCFNAIIE